MIITPLLKLAVDKKASDIFITVAAPIQIKIDGVSMPVNDQKMDSETIQRIAYEILTPDQISSFEANMEMNISLRVPQVGNFRVNFFRQRGDICIVIRYVPARILEIEELNLPPVLKTFASATHIRCSTADSRTTTSGSNGACPSGQQATIWYFPISRRGMVSRVCLAA